jgi:hypothetical protein
MRELPASAILSWILSSDLISDLIPAGWLVMVILESLTALLRSSLHDFWALVFDHCAGIAHGLTLLADHSAVIISLIMVIYHFMRGEPLLHA